MDAISDEVRGTPSADRMGKFPDRWQVYAALRLSTGYDAYTGLAGDVDFGPLPDTPDGGGADPQDKLIVIHEITADKQKEGKIKIEYICSAAARRPDTSDHSACLR
jgi:hypothetical protein